MNAGNQIIRGLLILVLITGAGAVLTACDTNGLNTMKNTDVVAGYGEKTFTERYHVDFTLPIPETQFLALLKQMGLRYESCGERGVGIGLPPPNHAPTVDLSRAQKCYKIYGGVDEVRHVGRRYQVFVDENNQVFYIENIFIYTGP